MSEQSDYLRTVADLQEIARKAPYVTQDWILQVASMDPADMRRRLIRHREVRAIVLELIRRANAA